MWGNHVDLGGNNQIFEVAMKIEGYDNSNAPGSLSEAQMYVTATMGTAGTFNHAGGSGGNSGGGSGQLINNGTYELVSESGAFLEAPGSVNLLKSRTNANGNKTRWRFEHLGNNEYHIFSCLLYTSPSPRDLSTSRMPSSA